MILNYIFAFTKSNSLKIKKHIARELMVKLGLFLVLLGAAWLFDCYHQGNPVPVEKTQLPKSKNIGESISFFCTTQPPVILKAPAQKVSSNKLCQEKFNRLIREQLNARSVFLLKAEITEQPNSCLALRNLISFRHHFLNHPDNQPPLC